MLEFDFKNKFYLISGASSGIGKAIALELNKAGAKILALGRNKQRLESLKAESKNPDLMFSEIVDLADSTNLDKKIFEFSKQYGRFDGATLSAGIQQTVPIQSALSVENAKMLFEINYFSNMQILKALSDRRANNNGCSIIFLSSNATIKANAGISQYSASKGALNVATKSLAIELAPKNIRVNAIAPGFTLTEMTESWSDIYDKEYIDKISKTYPLGLGKPSDIVGIAIFLLSPLSRWITGQIIVVDGGGSL
ncbi:short-chain dehydrogenase [Helicobacter sp. 16-1353]|uniref:SDR family NAD(P)-dependent oxidoreductase n=1 Tax=Helicobacter sp. 16-1353 TaxID=2004996 RepID=UPI000DCBB9D5|nr:SDR family oxidoreductase [Helicobacter sp. 16-1353]RAX51422.1 short-chain dehydrogenase [Helicobacter sp. 16-1353]